MENELVLNVSIGESLYGGPAHEVFSWERVLEICGMWDQQALYATIAGLVLTLVTMFYWGRWRKHIVDERIKFFLDKFLHTLIAMMFVIIIVRMMRGA